MSKYTWRELERADIDIAAAYAAEMERRAERTCKWEYPHGINGWKGYAVCSNCGEKYDECVTDTAHYCPNCGAKVVEE